MVVGEYQVMVYADGYYIREIATDNYIHKRPIRYQKIAAYILNNILPTNPPIDKLLRIIDGLCMLGEYINYSSYNYISIMDDDYEELVVYDDLILDYIAPYIINKVK